MENLLTTNREKAMAWWNSTNPWYLEATVSRYCVSNRDAAKFLSDRDIKTFTGREIENVWNFYQKEEVENIDFKKLEDWIECMVAHTNQNVPFMKSHAENAMNFLDKLAESSSFAQTAHEQLKSLRED